MTWSYKHVVVVAVAAVGCTAPNPAFFDTDPTSGTTTSTSTTPGTTTQTSPTTSPTTDVGSSGSGSTTGTSVSTSDGPTSSSGVSSSGTTGVDPTTTSGIGSSTGNNGGCPCAQNKVCTDENVCVGAQFFIEFEATVLHKANADYAPNNEANLDIPPEFPTIGFGGNDAMKDQVVDEVREIFTGLDVYITRQRPMNGEFSMIVLGDNLDGMALEAVTQDCGNENPTSVSIVNIYDGDMFPPTAKGRIIAHSIGHMSGLEHVEGDTNVMYQFVSFAQAYFAEACTELINAAQCSHTCQGTKQAGFEELEELYGAMP